MATAPCPFGRPLGMELIKRIAVDRGPDLSLISASALTAHAKREKHYRVRFWCDQPMGGGNNHYVELLILDYPPCGPDRAHLRAMTTWDNMVLIKNYNLKACKGDYYEFEEIKSHYIGTVYLFDLEEEFPPDSTHRGEIVKARFNNDIYPTQLEEQLSRRGYKLAIFDKYPLCTRATREPHELDPIWGLPYQGLTNIRIVRISGTDYTYEPVGDVISVGTYIMAEKL